MSVEEKQNDTQFSLKYLFARCRLKTKLWKMSYRLVLWLFFLN